MPRAFLIVLDSVGAGGAPDAAAFGDAGANTLGHIWQACEQGRADDGRCGPLAMPNLARLGLFHAVDLASGSACASGQAEGLWGAATEQSKGKDTPSGHWELAGLPVPWEWHYFPDTDPAFPPDLMALAAREAGTTGTLGNTHASGTEIIERFGAAHMRSGWPICYTSVDSVFQIAAHEESFGLERLLDLCRALAPTLHASKVGRVIARPFIGSAETGFTRTPNRRDFAITPPEPTLCDRVCDAGGQVHGIGKIGDIFSMQGISTSQKGRDADLMEALMVSVDRAEPGDLVFANFVEFDTEYGHRRDVAGYARHLEWFDTCLPRFFDRLGPGDLAIFTADHGNDPTWQGSDHTRERAPVVGYGLGARAIGQVGFADIGASLAQYLGAAPTKFGRSFL